MSDASVSREIPHPDDSVERRLVLLYFMAAMVYLAVSLLGGLLMGLQLVRMNPLVGIELLSPGRWRMIHTNAIAYGFLANAFLGALHWAIPRLTLKPLLSRGLSYLIFAVWQIVVLATVVGILLGHAQAVEWGETPTWIDPLALACLLLIALNFGAPIVRTKGPLYVTLWYFLAAFVWTFLTYALGNFLPQYFVSGTSAAAIGGLYMHDLVGLSVTPLGLGLMFYFVPVLLEKPIWSHGLALVGFWGLVFFYPLSGIDHYLYTPIPMLLRHAAIVATVGVALVTIAVVINFFATVRGCGRAVITNLPVRWFYAGSVFYVLAAAQGAMQATFTFQKLIHFTDWVVGHAHLVMFGVFSMWLLGIMTYLIPRILGRDWYSRRLAEWHFWLSVAGIGVMAGDLILLGVFQGLDWAALLPWDVSVDNSVPWWIVRLISGLAIIAGQLAFVYNWYKTWRLSVDATPADSLATAPA